MAITVKVSNPRRGPGTQAGAEFEVATCSFTWSWGASPASGVLTYVPKPPVAPVIVAGAWLEIWFPGLVFYGVAQSQPELDANNNVRATEVSSQGQTITVPFVDTRVYLGWDAVFGAFNMPDIRVVNGRRVKRYWHVLPSNAGTLERIFSDGPMSAAQILIYVFRAPTVETPWLLNFDSAPELWSTPVYNVDALGGRSLVDVVAEVTDRMGLVFTVLGGMLSLVWARKGVGVAPGFPADSDNQRKAIVLSGHATKVRVVGDRNRYQVMNVGLERDWNAGWEEFWDVDALAADLFDRLSEFNAIPGDVEQIQGRQKAAARAREITVREYSQLRGGGFNDYRRFQGRSRNDMPAALYIRLILFRAFRLPETVNLGGAVRSTLSMGVSDELLAGVNYDPTTGVMSAVLGDGSPDVVTYAGAGGNGFAIVKGYQAGMDIFQQVRPDRFNLSAFTSGQALWRPLSFQIDDGGDGHKALLFDEPVINLTDAVAVVDGHAVMKAVPVFAVAEVRACLTLEGERFQAVWGLTAGKDEVVPVPGLHAEYVANGGVLTEVVYADGQSASVKSWWVAQPYLAQPWTYLDGGYDLKLRDGVNLPQLTPMLDRVTVEYGPNGHVARVDFARERAPRYVKQLERDLDRSVQMQQLLPGQRELRAEANQMRLLAAAFRNDPGMVWQLREMFHGRLGGRGDLTPVLIESGTGTLPAGTPVWKPATVVSGGATATRAKMPATTGSGTPHFVGVTVRDGEKADAVVRVQASGEALARVLGPVAVGDAVCRADGQNYLQKAGVDSAGVVGKVMQAISGAVVKLVTVQLGGGAGGGSGGEVGFVWM